MWIIHFSNSAKLQPFEVHSTAHTHSLTHVRLVKISATRTPLYVIIIIVEDNLKGNTHSFDIRTRSFVRRLVLFTVQPSQSLRQTARQRVQRVYISLPAKRNNMRQLFQHRENLHFAWMYHDHELLKFICVFYCVHFSDTLHTVAHITIR